MTIHCCEPSRCCTCDEEPRRLDSCMCGCAYLNGRMQLFLGQFFSLVAGLLSVGSMIDCSFATIDPTVLDLGDGLEIEAVGVGFLFVQKSDGHCYWYNYAIDESKLQTYWGLLGRPWVFASIATLICACLSWLFFLYSISFCCSSQVKLIRHFIGFTMAGLMTIAQACTFVLYAENFCNDNNCSFSRGSATMLAAMACCLVAGLGFFFTADYPGEEGMEEWKEKKARREKENQRQQYDESDDDDEEANDEYDDDKNHPDQQDPYDKNNM